MIRHLADGATTALAGGRHGVVTYTGGLQQVGATVYCCSDRDICLIARKKHYNTNPREFKGAMLQESLGRLQLTSLDLS